MNKLLFTSFIFLTFVACTEEPNTPTYEDELLHGRWELTDAWRRNKKTEMLIGTYYEFNPTGTMRTNFPSEMDTGDHPYEFDGKIITVNDMENVFYTIDTLTESKLIFTTVYSNFPFKLSLIKNDSSGMDPTKEL
ncbi:MAG: hypothetical protein AAFZ15_20580 [Bacteroidota bacterium]